MDIQILQGFEGAKKAEGFTVMIDVFRAFSLETLLYAQGAKEVWPLREIQDALSYKQQFPSVILIGERNGKQLDGFDYGNSPSQIAGIDFTDKIILHTTSAGTQGLMLARKATRLFLGSLLNARATAEYIKSCSPSKVSLVALGWNGKKETEEDILCAEYMKEILLGKEEINMEERIELLKEQEGKKFFNEETQDIFPKDDFYACTKVDSQEMVIEVLREKNKMITRCVENER